MPLNICQDCTLTSERARVHVSLNNLHHTAKTVILRCLKAKTEGWKGNAANINAVPLVKWLIKCRHVRCELPGYACTISGSTAALTIFITAHTYFYAYACTHTHTLMYSTSACIIMCLYRLLLCIPAASGQIATP